MFGTRRFLTALSSVLGLRRDARTAPPRSTTSPGQTGPTATVEVDPARLKRLGWGFAPRRDSTLDPGEIVWTWVPYEERDGRGKDRPVVIVATLDRGAVLAVQLTSKDHTGQADHVGLGVGGWDRNRRPSWAAIDRLFRVHPDGVRRDGNSLDAARYRLIEQALRARYGWRR